MYRPLYNELYEKIQVGNDQENAHSKNRGGEKTKLTIRHIYVENISQAERTAISQQAASTIHLNLTKTEKTYSHKIQKAQKFDSKT